MLHDQERSLQDLDEKNGGQTSTSDELIKEVPEWVKKTLSHHFENIVSSSQVALTLQAYLNQLGMNKDNTKVANSVCPEETNHENVSDDITVMLLEKFGDVYEFGGLGGIPSIGKEGFKDFVGKIPDNGNALIYFAPHIGIEDGVIGNMKIAEHQHNKIPICYPVLTAFDYLLNAKEET